MFWIDAEKGWYPFDTPWGKELLSELIDSRKVRVWKTDSLHGDSPFTEQPGQCGEEGDYIQVEIFQRGAERLKIFDSHARCQKTFWQQKTLQLCLDLASCSNGLASGFVLIAN